MNNAPTVLLVNVCVCLLTTVDSTILSACNGTSDVQCSGRVLSMHELLPIYIA